MLRSPELWYNPRSTHTQSVDSRLRARARRYLHDDTPRPRDLRAAAIEGVDDHLESVKIVSMGHGQRFGSTNTHNGFTIFKLLETGFETLQDQFVGSHILAVSRSAKIRCRV